MRASTARRRASLARALLVVVLAAALLVPRAPAAEAANRTITYSVDGAVRVLARA
jgi:hypothetical protein